MASEKDLPAGWEAQLPPGAVVATRVSQSDLEGHRVTISKALLGVREVWLVAIADSKGRVSLRGPGVGAPSESILNLLVGQHRANCIARNARNN